MDGDFYVHGTPDKEFSGLEITYYTPFLFEIQRRRECDVVSRVLRRHCFIHLYKRYVVRSLVNTSPMVDPQEIKTVRDGPLSQSKVSNSQVGVF